MGTGRAASPVLGGLRMEIGKFLWAVPVLVCLVASTVLAGEREDYLLCITDELGRGTDLSKIGDLCLDGIRPPEERQRPEEEAEEYPYEQTLRAALVTEGSLLDPESAQFKDLVHSRSYNAWCGQVNAKNRLGGYAGWKYFAFRDRYRGSGKRKDHIDFQIGDMALVEKACKNYQAWRREYW